MAELDIESLVLNDIDVDTITNNLKTGVFDKLMASVNDNINVQFIEGRINSNDYANVYLGSLQAVLSQSMQFVLQEQVLEVQIANGLKDLELKEKQLESADLDIATKQYELDNILPESLVKLQEEIDLLETQDSEMLLDGVKKRILMDEEKETSDLQQELLQTEEEIKTAELAEVFAGTERADTQLEDMLLTSTAQRASTYTDRVLKDKQAAKLGLDNVMSKSENSRSTDDTFIYTPVYVEE